MTYAEVTALALDKVRDKIAKQISESNASLYFYEKWNFHGKQWEVFHEDFERFTPAELVAWDPCYGAKVTINAPEPTVIVGAPEETPQKRRYMKLRKP
jgi:hypothetical protein